MTPFVYILAASHSGSTLLTMLLNSHPDVATVGELAPGQMGDSSRYRCSCGTHIRACPFWEYVTSTATARGLDFAIEDFGTGFQMPESLIAAKLLRPLHRGPVWELARDAGLCLFSGWPGKSATIMRANDILVDVIMEYYRARIFVDKGNIAVRLKYLLRIPSFDVKVIRLIRDGRAVALTYMDTASFADAKDPEKRGGGMGGNGMNTRLSMAEAAQEWRRCHEEAEHALAHLKRSQWMEVHYEELCLDTANTLCRLFQFLNLDPQKRIADFRSVEHHLLGNGMRLDGTSDVKLDERWREMLTERDLQVFDQVAGGANRRYGYQ